MAREAAEVGHLEARGDRDSAPGLDGEDFARAIAVGGEDPHFATEARQIKAQPVKRFRSATVCACGFEVRADVQDLQDSIATNRFFRVGITSTVIPVVIQFATSFITYARLFCSKRARFVDFA